MSKRRATDRRRGAWRLAAAAVVGAMALAACGGTEDQGAEGGGEGAAGEQVELSFLVDNTDLSITLAEGLATSFSEENPEVTIAVESRPGGSEGDNLIKTRLATGDMTDIFMYNSGSLLQALNPQQTLVSLTDQPFVDRVDESFIAAVSVGDDVYGVPFGSATGGGVLYNRAIYEELSLEVPLTWDEFMQNNQAIADAGYTPVIQTYQDTWTSQLFVLGDYHNVETQQPGFAEDYTANEAKYATSEAALAGFQHLQEVHEAGYTNEDYGSATYAEGLGRLAEGEGAHYPMLTFAIPEIAATQPDSIDDVGFFALPGENAEDNGLTVWPAAGVYLPTSTEGAEREAALEFMDFVASEEGCEAQTAAAQPSGPYMVEGCGLPDDVPQAVQDMQPYFDEGATTPALEFLSPIKGPALEQITVEVGSGIRPAEDAAALYDQDVEKQAQQLGLEGW